MTTQVSFTRVDYTVSGLLEYIDLGDIGLPDIQRPFVWKATKVRDLIDSMYRGFPVGYLLFWKNANTDGAKQIGIEIKGHKVASLLIVDGQQRLTSLYAVFRGKTVINQDYKETNIKVAFRPRDGRFEVTDASIERDHEFIPNISMVWNSDKPSWGLVNDFINKIEEHKGPLSNDEKNTIGHNLDRLFDLRNYPFTALEILPAVDEEEVADIFVRINSQGVTLNQADFILTLMSVFWEEGRKELEEFCRQSYRPAAPHEGASSFNHFIQPRPDQMLRVGIALAFYRGRLKSVYQVLRGKDVETDTYIPEKRDHQFGLLKNSQEKVLNLTYWHQFLSCIMGAGYRGKEMISSQNSLLFSYAFYLIGKFKHNIPEHILDRLIGRWFFVSHMVGRYSSSPETTFDMDLARIKNLDSADAFIAALDRIISDAVTEDYWAITLPNSLDNSSARSPALFAYYAALNLLDAPVLFSHKRVKDLFDPAIKSKKKALERHHLFPRAWLENQEITKDLKQINQIANFAPIEWPENINIGAKSPAEYMAEMRERYKENPHVLDRMLEAHGLPIGWEHLPYNEFLEFRRKSMAQIIKTGYSKLTTEKGVESEVSEAQTSLQSLQDLIATQENEKVEFKSSARWNLYRNDKDPEIELVIAKTIAGFMNAGGGTLLIGVNDEGEIVGLENDFKLLKKKNADGFQLWLLDFIENCIGKPATASLRVSFPPDSGKDVCRVDIPAAIKPVFVSPPKTTGTADFYVRIGNSTRKLSTDEVLEYQQSRWG